MKVIAVALFAYVAVASAAYSYPPPASSRQMEDQPPTPYSFEYAVSDEPSGNDFGHQEESDGKVVTGQYRVLLPDGRTQIVTYRADENGYRANVRYEGEAVFPPPPPKVSYPPPAPKADYPPKPAYPKY